MNTLVNDNVISTLLNDEQFRKEFKATLNGLIDNELAKSEDEMDCDLIDECTEMLIQLEQEEENGLPVIIPPITSKQIIKACTKRDFKSLNRGLRASLVACIILLSTVTCNVAVTKITGRNIAQEVATSINKKLDEWGFISFADDDAVETVIKPASVNGNENLNGGFDDDHYGNENVNGGFDDDKAIIFIPTGNENINGGFDNDETGNENLNGGFEDDETGNENLNGGFDDDETGNENIDGGFDDDNAVKPGKNQYVISFDSNGGEQLAPVVVTYGKKIGTLPSPEREGYIFKGWYNIDIAFKWEKAANIVQYKVAIPVTPDTVYKLKDNAVLTAQWDEAYTISFCADNNNGDGICDVATLKVDKNGKLPYIPVPTCNKEGYVFDYWYYTIKTNNIAKRSVRVTENTVFTEDTKLYAKYVVDRNEFVMEFLSEGYAIDGLEAIPVFYGRPYGELPVPEPEVDGLIFIGWFDGSNISAPRITADTIHTKREDIYVNALWTTAIYKLNLDTNGGNEEYEQDEAYCGHAFANLPTPTRDGYTFVDWTLNDISVKNLTCPDLEDTGLDEVTLVAKWSPNQIDIVFDGNGGDVRKNKYTYKYDSPFKNLPEATRAHYEFDGWYTDAEEGELITVDSIVSFTDSTILYAHWKAIADEKVYVTVHNNRTVDDTYTIAYNVGDELGSITKPATTTSTESYLSFMGWYDDKYYGNQLSNNTIVTEDMDIYAHWTVVSALSPFAVRIYITGINSIYDVGEPIDFDNVKVIISSPIGLPDSDVNLADILEEGDSIENHFFGADTSTPGEHTMTFRYASDEFVLVGAGTVTIEQTKSYTVVGCNHINTQIENFVQADCSKKGYSGDLVCVDCGRVIEKGTAVEMTDHPELVFVAGAEPTCTKGSSSYYKCAVCNKVVGEKIIIAPLGHSTTYYIKDACDPTCSEAGYTGDKCCDVCGEIIERGSVISALPHPDYYISGQREATCKRKGYTGDKLCTACGDLIEEGSYIAKLPHANIELVDAYEPTCSSDGGYTGDYVCLDCGTVIQKGEFIEPLPHGELVFADEREATCSKAGYTGDWVCTVCGEVVYEGEVIPALPHETAVVNVSEATCTTKGYTGDQVCTVCGKVVKNGKSTATLGHKNTETIGFVPNSCTEAGYSGDVICHDCGQVVTKGATLKAAGHNYVACETVPATVGVDGYVMKECNRCGATTKSTILAIENVSLSKTKYEYDGNEFTPTVSVKSINNTNISTDYYDIIRPESSVEIGEYTITVVFKGYYTGSVELKYEITDPDKSVKFTGYSDANGCQLFWNEVEGVDGYELKICLWTDRVEFDFYLPSDQTSITLSSTYSSTSYYAIIRTYTIEEIDGEQVYVYSDWTPKYFYSK